MQEVTDIKKVVIKKLEGDLVNGNKNVVIETAKTLWEWPTLDLKIEKIRCSDKVKKYRTKLMPAIIILCMGALALCIQIAGTEPVNHQLILSTFAISWLAPFIWIMFLDREIGCSLKHYQKRIKEINLILEDRE